LSKLAAEKLIELSQEEIIELVKNRINTLISEFIKHRKDRYQSKNEQNSLVEKINKVLFEKALVLLDLKVSIRNSDNSISELIHYKSPFRIQID